jgi:hypothetical protein
MRKELVCPRCGGVLFWHIRALEEHTGYGEKPLAVRLRPYPLAAEPLHRQPDGSNPANGYFELLVCEGCKHVEWYACNLDPEGLKTEPFACPACGSGQAWHVPRLEERALDFHNNWRALPVLWTLSGWDGYYSLAVCCQCGLTAFTAHELDAVTQYRNGVRVAPGACERCHASDKLRIDAATEVSGSRIRPLHLSRREWWRGDVGKLSPEVCRGCGATVWWALELDKRREDAKRGVARLDGNARAVADGGPYR